MQKNQRSNGQHLLDHRESKAIPENIYFCFINYTKAFYCVDHNKLWKILRDGNVQITLSVSWETCMWVKKQHLEPDMEQQTNSKLGKEYNKVVYRHPACLIYMQIT